MSVVGNLQFIIFLEGLRQQILGQTRKVGICILSLTKHSFAVIRKGMVHGRRPVFYSAELGQCLSCFMPLAACAGIILVHGGGCYGISRSEIARHPSLYAHSKSSEYFSNKPLVVLSIYDSLKNLCDLRGTCTTMANGANGRFFTRSATLQAAV